MGFLLLGAFFAGVSGGCGNRNTGDDSNRAEQQNGNVTTGQTGETDNSAKDSENLNLPENFGLSSERLIGEQTFTVELKGIGEVTFASYAPGSEQSPQADVVFALLNGDGAVYQILDGMWDDDIRAAVESFDGVEAVAFPDYNGDGYEDAITISAYSCVSGPDVGTGFSEVRVYRNSGEKLVLEKETSEMVTSALAEVTISSVLGFLRGSDAAPSGSAQGNGVQTGDDGRMAAYAAALEGIYVNHVFPDGTPCDDLWGFDDMDQNQFAIYDVDFDGNAELLISYTAASMAGMMELVYDYDAESGSLKEELREFPYVTYYDNGIVWAGLSHNHGMAPDLEDFWPYVLYEYVPSQDCYVMLAGIDAWQRIYAEEDYAGNLFPADVDEDGDGVVYYLWTQDTAEAEIFYDREEYEKWRGLKYGEAEELKIPYVSITRENIDALN